MRTQITLSAGNRTGVTVVDGRAVEWINGAHAFASLTPAFRDNLGDPGRVSDLLERYWLRPLWVDSDTTRRIDHVRVEAGYDDLTEAYHGSVEEALFLGGSATLTAEGQMWPGDYFWRPPGWVHSASTATGFECLLMMEGDEPDEGSGPVSRVICRDEDAGSHVPPAGDAAPAPIGPRGYVRRLETRFLPAAEHDDARTRLLGPGAAPLASRVLSRNVRTGSETVLITVPPAWASSLPAVDRERFLVVVDGALSVDGREITPCSLVRITPRSAGPELSSAAGATIFVKVGSPK